MKKFTLRGIFTEQDGKPSFSRIFLGLFILCAIAWVWYLIIKNNAMPDLGGLAGLLTAVGTVTYGYNQVKNIVAAATGKNGN